MIDLNKKRKEHPVLKNLPDRLKDPKCFLEIEKKIEKIMYSDHKHNTVKGFIKCKQCQNKFQKKREFIREQGFNGIEQYQLWKKIMVILLQEKDFYLK